MLVPGIKDLSTALIDRTLSNKWLFMKQLIIVVFLFSFASPSLIYSEEPPLSILEAVTFALANTPEISLAREDINEKKAMVDIEKGDQEPSVSLDITFDREDTPLTPYSQSVYEKEAEKTKTFTSTLSLAKEFESGITITPSISLKRVQDDLVNLDDGVDNTATAEFTLDIPLFEVMNYLKEGDQPFLSDIDLEASYWKLAHKASEKAADTAVAFWNALAAQKLLSLHKESEKEAKKFYEDMVLLVEKDEYPIADLNQAKVTWDEQVITRMTADKTLFSAHQNLAIAMGVQTENLFDLPRLQEEFPELQKKTADTKSIIQSALENRMDLSAQKIRLVYYKRLIKDASENLLPELDLSLNVGYNGLLEEDGWDGYLESLHTNVPGLTYGVGLTFTKTFGNRSAKGELSKKKTLFQREKIKEAFLKRKINSDVLTALQTVEINMAILEQQKDVVERYSRVMEDTKLKFKYQNATLTDLIDKREDYRNSRIDLLESKKAYADAIINLRRACGSLIVSRNDRFIITRADLFDPYQNLDKTQLERD